MLSKRLDLNLLGVFQAIYQTRNVTLAARHHNITQPAMSNALARLREVFADPLFVPGPYGMRPTPYAQQLAAPIERALREVEQALAMSKGFDPASSDREFRMHLTDFAQVAFLPALLERLRAQAPRVAIRVEALAEEAIRPALDEGRLDFAFGRMSKAAGHGVGRHALFKDRYAVLMRAGHPLAGQALSRKDFVASEQVLVCTSGHQAVEDMLVKMGARIALRLPSFLVVSRIVETSDFMVIIPARLAEQCAATGQFHMAALPVAMPAFDVSLFWSESRSADPAHAWMRELLQQLFGQRDVAAPA
ncbi:LysR family transcriptional regulator [Ralstonia pseudosolanacearum]|uniref:LysR family transcriptional regulator n=3 Tax=Ralstonia solanacearum species complex TaxID=3116862 RepID=A0A454TI34_9RALS|nr:LysR family transcriptional regulator [Ralstonia pseudosolanacearum]AUS44160.1 LysR family transcriptional regulator [Ralstonia solanacearum]AYA48496.1 LysR family transcriptional regulator [Ralstonia pseudosolanacearum]MCK4135682.1 LysR family transcriptional regulator [Ralstonia pseudosolanacearum]MCK4143614.1 LysR family transcriptional regulator [Ralstonia pseudosolanacearum]MCK4152584.1 LysR family transcriptional regulator [Ralstonia pseudosolanacearum]